MLWYAIKTNAGHQASQDDQCRRQTSQASSNMSNVHKKLLFAAATTVTSALLQANQQTSRSSNSEYKCQEVGPC
jgi:hypothetical protein